MVRPHRKKITAKTTKIAAHVTLKELSDRDFNVFSKSNSFYPYLNTLNLTRRLGENIAPLGTITYLRNHAKNKYRFDKKFLSRLDYKLWYTLTKHEGRFYTDGVLSIIEEGLKHENTTITWGVLSCLSALRSNQEVMLNKHKLLELLKIAEKRLDNISPITDLEADCFLVFIRFKSYKQRFVYNTLSERHPFTLLAELFENACHALRQIDLKWELGSDLSLESFKIARDKGLSLIPWHYHDFSSNIAYILCQLSFALIFSLEYIDKKNQDLLDISTNLMRSAWLLQRSHRIRESTLTRKSKQDLDKIKYNEFQALNFYIQTLRSAGNFNLANIHAWYFLVTLPPNFEKTSDFEFVPTNMAGNVRQAGLTVDSRRYPQLKKNTRIDEHKLTWTILPDPAKTWDKNIERSVLDHRTKTTQWVNSNTQEKDRLTDFQPKEVFHKDIFRSRVQYDIEHNDVTRADWQTILVIAGSDGDPWDTFNTWLKRLKQPSKKLLENVSSDFMESIVRLAFYYDQINSVASILSHMPLPPEKFIRDFANIIQDQCTAFPLAIDENVLNKWITSVRKCVNKTGFINEYEVIHGALKTQLLHAHTTPSIHLVEKLFDLKIKDGWSPDIPPKTKIEICKDIIVDTQVIGKKIKAVYVSQVDLEETEIIFCTIDGHQFENEKYSQEVYCKKICQTYEWELATINKNGRERLKGGRCAIPGNEALDHLKKTVKKILELASKLIGDCPEIVYFSPSPDWINAPWQYLFYTAATANSKSLWPIISIVPSLVWMQAAFSHLSPKKHLEYCISQETDLADAAAKLDKLYPPNTEAESSISQYIVFGHGQPPTLTTPFATINAPNSPFTIDRWIEASGFDAYILHACSCAKIMPLFAGTDYGGAPGLLLLLKGKVILAPCIEIHPDVALTLQSEIFEQMKQPHCTYADAYRAAVDKDERCLFYTIFGLATLPLMSKSCDFDK